MAAVVSFDSRSEGEQLGNRIAELNAYITVAQAEFLELLREFDTQRYWEELGFTSCAHWLNFKCGIGFNAARERLRMAHALVDLPKIRMAFAEGTLSFSKVRAMTQVATPDNEDLLLNIARQGTAYHVERFVSEYRRIEKLQEPGAAEDLHERRELSYRYDEDGCLVLEARLPADQGELVVKALERAMELYYVEAEDREPVAALRADALRDIAETYLNHPENPGSTADRYQIVVHVLKSPEASVAQLENGPHVSTETWERIACDCSVVTIEEDELGDPLNIGRRSRTIPPPMRRALLARDGGCRFPGCTAPRFCDGHHIEHWQHGGETRLDNLVLLCRHHHRLVHEGGFDCQRTETGEIFFVDRQRRRLAENERRSAVSIEETLAWMYRRFARHRLDADTAPARWSAGERMDWDHAAFVAFQRPPPPTG